MSSASRAQLGFKKETSWNTPVTVDRFAEFNTEGLKLVPKRTESAGLRNGQRVMRSDRYVPWNLGAAGPISAEVLTKGFGLWFQLLLGAVSTSSVTDSVYTHTCTLANLKGLSQTLQINKPLYPGDSDQAFTYSGCKITTGKLSNSIDGLLMLELGIDAAQYLTSTALAAASYPTSTQPFSWAGGLVTVGGSNYDITDIEISIDNQLKTDATYIRNSTVKKEPQEQKLRTIGWKMTSDFDSLTQHDRWASLVAANNIAQIVATWTGPVLAGSTTYPTVTVTIPAARFDGDDPTVGGPDPLTQVPTGVGLYDGTNSPITIAYGTTDSTP